MYREVVNLVTSGNATISLATCIVGLVLFLPRTNLRAAANYTLMSINRLRVTSSSSHRIGDPVAVVVPDDISAVSTDNRELVDA